MRGRPASEKHEKCSSNNYGNQLRRLTGYRVKKVAKPPEKKMLKCGGHICEEEYCNSLCVCSIGEETDECSSDSYMKQTGYAHRSSPSYSAFQLL